MHFLQYSVLLVCLSIASSLALSDEANAVLKDISAVQKSLDSNQEALDRYKGGLAAATPILTGFYDTWTSLRTANAHMPRDMNLTSEDYGAIYDGLSSANDKSLGIFHSFEEKAPLFHQSGGSFIIPIFMEAIDREVENYSGSLKGLMPGNYTAQMDQLRSEHTKAWDATFAAYEPVGNSNKNQQVMRFASMVTPVLGYLPL